MNSSGVGLALPAGKRERTSLASEREEFIVGDGRNPWETAVFRMSSMAAAL
jgi:hypothetical protein